MSTSKRKIVVIGAGGREDALARRLARCSSVAEVLVAPGNVGSRSVGQSVALPFDPAPPFVEWAASQRIDLAVIGPEAPLVAGLADALRERAIPVFGPSAAAARLEGSKAFMKRFCARHGVPTSPFAIFDDAEEAVAYIRERGKPVVVKADGLCAGKGVVVAADVEAAERAAREMLSGAAFGAAGKTIVVEDRTPGAEASIHALCDGKRFFVLPAVQDHKRIGEGDTGPNTGGMGAYGPAPLVTAALEDRVRREIFERTLDGMAKEGAPFVGALYAGLMITPEGDPSLIEYNVRFGDPETEVLVDLVDGDWADALAGAASGNLPAAPLVRANRHALAVVLAAEGYPGKVTTGDRIEGLDRAARVEGAAVLHAGTRAEGDAIVTAGGRVLVVTATGDSLRQARDRAYEAAGHISFRGMQMRRDIGHHALGAS